MINQKNILGHNPDQLGIKDAVHVAIVAVRAGRHLRVGQEVRINEHNEAVPVYGKEKGVGYVSPFVQGEVLCGTTFWLMMKPTEVASLRHEWDHAKFDFVPTREVQLNKWLKELADDFQISYSDLMDACNHCVVGGWTPATYTGPLSRQEFDEVMDKNDDFMSWELWDEWADEANHEFENIGSSCCPEYEQPECLLFKYPTDSVSEA
jgi:hypothetical protein